MRYDDFLRECHHRIVENVTGEGIRPRSVADPQPPDSVAKLIVGAYNHADGTAWFNERERR